MPPQLDKAQAIIDHAAIQQPSWWIAAAGIIFLAGIVVGVWWIVRQYSALTHDLKESNAETIRILTGVVQASTTATMDHTAKIGIMSERLKDLDTAVRGFPRQPA